APAQGTQPLAVQPNSGSEVDTQLPLHGFWESPHSSGASVDASLSSAPRSASPASSAPVETTTVSSRPMSFAHPKRQSDAPRRGGHLSDQRAPAALRCLSLIPAINTRVFLEWLRALLASSFGFRRLRSGRASQRVTLGDANCERRTLSST